MIEVGCCNNVRGTMSLLTYDRFYQEIRSEKMNRLIDEIRNGHPEKKRELFAVTWQASFRDGKRCDANAIPSGLFMLDIDNLSPSLPQGESAVTPVSLWQSFCDRVDELGIIMVHCTPSGCGLRVVAMCRPEFDTIAENQKWLAEQIGTEYDAVCRDWARMSFLSKEEDFYYIRPNFLELDQTLSLTLPHNGEGSSHTDCKQGRDDEVYEQGKKVIDEMYGMASSETADSSLDPDRVTPPSGGGDGGEVLYNPTLRFGTIFYKDIVDEFWKRTYGGVPTVGSRHASLMNLARNLGYITDFDADTLVKVLPPLKPQKEIVELVHDTLEWQKKNNRRSPMIPNKLWSIIKDLEREQGVEESAIDDNIVIEDDMAVNAPIPECPPGIQEFVENAPRKFRSAVILASLPMWGTLATRVRGIYTQKISDAERQQMIAEFGEAKALKKKPKQWTNALNFMVVIMGRQGIGKSFARDMNDLIMGPLIRESEEMDAEVNGWTPPKDSKEANNPLQPASPGRYVDSSFTIPAITNRMATAENIHLYGFTPEIDTYGKMMQALINLLRQSFDNDRFGQVRATKAGVTAHADVYFNLLCTGTVDSVMSIYNPHVNDGLVSRTIFVPIAAAEGQRSALFLEMEPRQKRVIERLVKRLMDETRTATFNPETGKYDVALKPVIEYRLAWLDEAIYDWETQQLEQVRKDVDSARDIFMSRAKVIGYRAGLLAWHLWHRNTPENRQKTIQFALWVATNVLEMLLMVFAKTLQKTAGQESLDTRRTSNVQATTFDLLPNVFTNKDLETLLLKSAKRTPARVVACKWREANMIATLDGKNYKLGTEEYEAATSPLTLTPSLRSPIVPLSTDNCSQGGGNELDLFSDVADGIC